MPDIHPHDEILLIAEDEAWRERRRVARKVVRACAEEQDWPWEDITLVTNQLGLRGEL